jgi:GTP-binding protein
MIDASGYEGRDPLDDWKQINEELRLYQPELAERPQLVVLNKMDLPEARENEKRLRKAIGLPRDDVFAISAATGDQVQPLVQRMAERLRELPSPFADIGQSNEVLRWPEPEVDPDAFTIEREGDAYRVRGKKIETLVSMLNFAQPESLDRLQRVLEASGITQALIDAGVGEGDTVRIEKAELEWSDELSA